MTTRTPTSLPLRTFANNEDDLVSFATFETRDEKGGGQVEAAGRSPEEGGVVNKPRSRGGRKHCKAQYTRYLARDLHDMQRKSYVFTRKSK